LVFARRAVHISMKLMPMFKTGMLDVPGAQIYYEVRGSGPVLLMMPGGPADATTFRKIENRLAERFTVVTYDPRGLSHSTALDSKDDARMVEVFADDAYRLIDTVGAPGAKASVFANSGGAVIALELARRHADRLEAVVAHEPPSPDLLPESEEMRAAMNNVCDTYAEAGLWPAAQKFMALIGIQGGPPPAPEGEPTPEAAEAMAVMQRNMNLFIGRYIRNLANYRPDLEALKACPCRIVPAVGAESGGQLAHNGGLGLARVLGIDAAVLPGDHGGFDGRPEEFAEKLLEVLG
jgi:pimeloyl-ACP methyl ester carboxylesterase